MFWFRIVPHLQSSLRTNKFQKLNEKLFLNRECTGDLKIICQGEVFNCHELVLSCQSDVFCTMLSSGKMLESKSGEVKIDDVKPEVMEILLHFIYHDALKVRLLEYYVDLNAITS